MSRQKKDQNILYKIKSILNNYSDLCDFDLLKLCIISTSIFTLLANGMGIFNKYSYFDDLVALFAGGRTFMLGRWGLGIIHKLFMIFYGDFVSSLPIYNSIFSIVFLALSSYLLITIFKININLIKIFTCAFIAAFPVITSCYGYMFMLQYFTMAIFLSILSTYFIFFKNDIVSCILGISIGAFSIGIYQAVLSNIIAIAILFYIRYIMLYYNKTSMRNLLKSMIISFISILCIIALYLCINKIFLNILHISLSSYQGLSSMYTTSIFEYFNRIKIAYMDFIFPGVSNIYYKSLIIFYYISILYIIIFLMMISRKLLYHNCGIFIIYILLSFLIPLSINSIYIIASPNITYSMMVYSKVFLFILLFIIFDYAVQNTYLCRFFNDILKNFVVTLIMIILVLFIRIDNQCYLKAALYQSEAISYLTTMITQIKSTDGYTDDLPICFVNVNKLNDKTFNNIFQLEYIDIAPYGNMHTYLNNYAWDQIMFKWCGFNPDMISEDYYTDNIFVKNMPHYPSKGSIKIVDNVVVVKF